MNSSNLSFDFCGQPLGDGVAPWIVAEVGLNHNGDVELAKRMLRSAKENGADAVKLQTFVSTELVSRRALMRDPDHPETNIHQYEFFQRYELKREEYAALFELAKELDLPLFSAPFDDQSLEMLADLGCPAFKIASPDLTYHEFLKRVARLGRPVVLSSGTSSLAETKAAAQVIRDAGNERLVVLHCVSHYPAVREEMNLNCLPLLRETLGVPVGLSDHTMDSASALAATALGAAMIEKHFTLDRKLPGPDQPLSIEPGELRELKTLSQNIFQTLGKAVKESQPEEEPVKQSARRSLTALVDIEPGTVLTREMIGVKRPGTGIQPGQLERAIGCVSRTQIFSDQTLTWDLIRPPESNGSK
ncbi:MAG: hypothetical protein G3M78_00515 [Candidatus Nitrohelix vancouverensis]|uniref:AFP-like domain-containing protein n=1 Tax=Candidatus Nitrohelix vancouverensis TaxID=2705534 RepID=A0A7T0BZW0_9BACT|nr:MAG: hypothetical protein G3M78_00515 [Candidatus Nitrohelix vancouverensis]